MKKHIVFIACAAMALTVATGCSKKEEAATTAAQETTAQAAETKEETAAETEKAEESKAEAAAEDGNKKTVAIENDGHTIPGILTMPEGVAEGEKVPAVVMLHGTGSNKDEAGNGYVYMADEFAKAGIASLRFDFIGTGDSTVDYSEYCNTTAVSDAIAAGKFLAEQDGIDAERIGIMGWSQGGTDALLTAAESDMFKSVLTWAGSMTLGEMVTDEMYEEAKKNGFTVMEFDWREPLNLGLQWIEEAKSTDMTEVVAKISAPIMAINGSADTVVPPTEAEQIKELSTNEASELVILEGGDHTFGIFGEDHTVFNKLMEETAKWFTETL